MIPEPNSIIEWIGYFTIVSIISLIMGYIAYNYVELFIRLKRIEKLFGIKHETHCLIYGCYSETTSNELERIKDTFAKIMHIMSCDTCETNNKYDKIVFCDTFMKKWREF